MAQKFGILGGTFNPIHYGHLAAAEEVRDRLKLDRVLFIPSYLPPHKHEEDMPPAVRRLEMLRLAIASNPLFSVSDIEVKRGGKSYTIETVTTLRAMHPATEFYFITGLDSFLEIQMWNNWERLLPLCSFVVLSRPGYRFADLMKIDFMKGASKVLAALDRGEQMHAMFQPDGFKICLEMIPLYDISSTDIRKRIRDSRTVKYHLPEDVETYIMKNKLYA